MISAEGTTYGYPVRGSHGTKKNGNALGPITIDFPESSFTTLIGPSGCGKTTLLEILAGQRPPDDGEVFINGKKLYSGTPIPAPERIDRWFRDGNPLGISMIFQNALVFPWMTARENVEFALTLRGVKKPADRAMFWLKRVGLADDFRKYPSQLSGGMVQRLGLARALACEPRILLMDEPFSALDPLTRSELHGELMSLWRDSGCTAVLVTHDLDEAVELSDKVVFVSGAPGRIRTIVPVTFERPRSRMETDYQELYTSFHHLLDTYGGKHV